jgi:hypothetical protein
MRIAYLLLSLLISASAWAAPFDPNEIPKDQVAYRLSFCARPFPDSNLGVPPHAFIALNTVDPAQKRVFHAFGTVKGTQPRALIGHAAILNPVPATLTTAEYSSLMQNCLVVPVSKNEYQAAEKMVYSQVSAMALTVPKTDIYGVYGLAPDGCAAMFVKVMKSLPKKGMMVPEQFGSEPPIGYLRRLIDQNLRRPS